MRDKLFTLFLKYSAKFIRLFISEPKLGKVDTNRSDSLKEKR